MRLLGSDPKSKKDIEVKRGRYGFYITDGKVNVSIKNGEDATIIDVACSCVHGLVPYLRDLQTCRSSGDL